MDKTLPLIGALVITIALIAISLRFSMGSTKTEKGYWLMEQSATPWMVGLSYTATMISAFLFVGLPGLFYTHGIGTWLYVCLPVLCGVVFFSWYGVGLRRLQVQFGTISPYETIGAAYRSKWLGVICLFLTTFFVIPIISMQIVAFGRLLEGYGVNYHAGIVAMVVIFVGYTMLAGMKGDVITDLFQGALMLIGIMGLAVYCLISFNQTPSVQVLDQRLFSLPGPNGLFTTPQLVSLLFMMGSLPLVHGHYMMRFMIAKDEATIHKAMPWAVVSIFLLYSSAAVMGLIGSSLYPGLATGDKLVGTILGQLSGIGVVAGMILLAAIAASSLSSVDSQFLALGSSFVRDLLQNGLGVSMDLSRKRKVARGTMIFFGILSWLIALNPPPLVAQLAVFAASGTLVLVPTFLFSLRESKPSSLVALASILLGFTVFLWAAFFKKSVDFGGWHAGMIGFVASSLIFSVGWAIESAVLSNAKQTTPEFPRSQTPPSHD